MEMGKCIRRTKEGEIMKLELEIDEELLNQAVLEKMATHLAEYYIGDEYSSSQAKVRRKQLLSKIDLNKMMPEMSSALFRKFFEERIY